MVTLVHNLYKAFNRSIDHGAIEHSGYMSFIVLLSIFPYCIFILAFTSFIGASSIGKNVINLALAHIPENSIELIRSRIDELIKTPPQSLLTLAVVGSVWTASSFVECLRTILNRVYEITEPPKYIFRRLLSIAQFFLISFMFTVFMIILTLIPISITKLSLASYDLPLWQYLKDYKIFFQMLRYLIMFFVLFFSACSLYYIIPNKKLKFSEVLPGAAITVLLWMISGFLLSKYLRYYHQLNYIYGSLGSVIITIIFFYILNIIFIYGAEYNYINSYES